MKKPEEQENLVFYSLYKRPAHGCLPLFVLLALAFGAAVLLLVKVTMTEPLKPRGEGVVHVNTGADTRFLVLRRSVMPLLLPLAPEKLPDSTALPTARTLQPQQAPAVPLFSEIPDSAVLDAAELLALPPAADGKEAR